jgi:beta-galactosidase
MEAKNITPRNSGMTELMRLGTCYYPEHVPETQWADDARDMASLGLSRVRIAEFAWSRIEPEPGRYDWAWMDRAVSVLEDARLGIIMGTPTATPPKWLVDHMPDMVAIDAAGQPRTFGSRRHYCFSHEGYRQEAARITRAMAERYGNHPAIIAWQTDNEYGCHDSVISYSDAAKRAFRQWLSVKYGDIGALNLAWGAVFWSMEFRNFAEIDLHSLTVTEANPAQALDFRRFSSDQVVRFNRAQVEILRASSPGRDIIHNFMGFFTEFDHHDVGEDLDVSSWDSYPLGFLEQFWFSDAEKQLYVRQGHPDIAAFHHDLYRGCSSGRWSVMEQQPGPVNWARFNPAPLPGMVRLWTLEAMAHGAEMVSYFRWQQFGQAQEQMHAGLLRPDRIEDTAAHEARQAVADIDTIGPLGAPPKSVALLFDYQADWITGIQPQGKGFSALRLAYEFYTAARQLGLDVDIIRPGTPLHGYQLVLIPCLPILSENTVETLANFAGPILIGPRTGSKTADFAIPDALAPGLLQSLLPIKVVRVESLRDGAEEEGSDFTIRLWLEKVESDLTPDITLKNGRGIVYRNGQLRYVAGWPDAALLAQLIATMTAECGTAFSALPEGLRMRRAGQYCFAFNYSSETAILPADDTRQFILGSTEIGPAGVAVWATHA